MDSICPTILWLESDQDFLFPYLFILWNSLGSFFWIEQIDKEGVSGIMLKKLLKIKELLECIREP